MDLVFNLRLVIRCHIRDTDRKVDVNLIVTRTWWHSCPFIESEQ